MTVIYDPLTGPVIDALDRLLAARPEPYTADVTVANKVIAGRDRMVTIVPGPGGGARDMLDAASLRINVYAPDEADAEDLAALVRALIESRAPQGIIDGRPITTARVSSRPSPIPNETRFQQYMVADLICRGRQLD